MAKPEENEKETPPTPPADPPASRGGTKAKAASGPAPGMCTIRFLFDSYNQDFGTAELHKQGKTMDVEAAKAHRLMAEYGPPQRGKIFNDKKDAKGPLPGDKITELGCPFEIIAENKALAGADETK